MSSKQELRDEIAELSESRDGWASAADTLRWERNRARRERDEARAEVAALVSERNDALDRLNKAQGLIRALATSKPAQPRPFQVGDRVRVAEGAKARNSHGQPMDSYASGREGEVEQVHQDGDLWLGMHGYNHVAVRDALIRVSPEFCTLIPADGPALAWDTPADLDPAPTHQGVTLYLPDGGQVWIPCEDPDLDEDTKGLWVLPTGCTPGQVGAWVNPAAIVAAVVNR